MAQVKEMMRHHRAIDDGRLSTGHLFGVLVMMVVAAVAAWGCAEQRREPRGGLEVYVDAQLALQLDANDLARRPSDYERGGLRGWTLFGGLLGAERAQDATSLIVRGGSGQEIRISDLRSVRGSRLPAVFVDRRDRLRFVMASRVERNAVPHGRGPGDGRGTGGGRDEAPGMTLDDVRAIVVQTDGGAKSLGEPSSH